MNLILIKCNHSIGKNHPKIDEEILKMQQNIANNSSSSRTEFSILTEIKKPELYKPLLIMFAFFTIQQFSGIFTIFIYAAQFSIEAGVSVDAFLSAVIIGSIRCVTTIIISFASDYYGRRPLAMFSSIGMFLSMFGLVLCSIFTNQIKASSSVFWLPTVLLYFFIFSGTTGILTLPFAILGEIYPQRAKGFAVGLTIFYAYTMSFINVKTFSSVFALFGSVVIFSFYGIVALLGFLFAVLCLPETKGKTLQEIEEYFRK
jgi:MFS family permease